MLNKLLDVLPNILCAAIAIMMAALAVSGAVWSINVMINAFSRLGGM